MMQVEIMTGDNDGGLQREINEWLQRNPGCEIVHVAQSVTHPEPGRTLKHLTFVWRQGPRLKATGVAGQIQKFLDKPPGEKAPG